MTAIALTIAGSDSGGGAGIQADLKTFAALGVYGASAITALTAQNTQGVDAVLAVPPDFVRAQMWAIARDLDVGAIKIGMLAAAPVVAAVADGLADFPGVPVVLDPVMVAASGDRLLDAEAVETLRVRFMPLATLITPNLAEAAALLGTSEARDEREMEQQGTELLAAGARAVLIKGGHLRGPQAVDLLVTTAGVERFAAPRIETRNTHGTGCTLSSAIAAELAKGASLREAVGVAKAYLTTALQHADDLQIGKGRGPVHHFHNYWPRPK
jgi:hydroxymethylpyrimidine/phosphomethylpyrimidine kinase